MVAGFAWVIGKGVRVWFIDGVGAVATPRAPFTSAGISMRPVAPSGPTALLPGSALLPHSDSALAPPLASRSSVAASPHFSLSLDLSLPFRRR